MNIKTGCVLFQTLCYIITPISGIIDHDCIMEKIFKKIGKKIRINEEQYILKIRDILRTASLGPEVEKSIFSCL